MAKNFRIINFPTKEQIEILLMESLTSITQGPPGPKGDPGFPTNAPSGKCRVTNLWVEPETGKLIVEYENTPVP